MSQEILLSTTWFSTLLCDGSSLSFQSSVWTPSQSPALFPGTSSWTFSLHKEMRKHDTVAKSRAYLEVIHELFRHVVGKALRSLPVSRSHTDCGWSARCWRLRGSQRHHRGSSPALRSEGLQSLAQR